MKTTIKRTLATVLAVVMIFSLIPFAGTILGSMSTKVSALETVEGSFDYLVDYLKEHGIYDDDGDLCIIDEYSLLDSDLFIEIFIHPEEEDTIYCYFSSDNEDSFNWCVMSMEIDSNIYDVYFETYHNIDGSFEVTESASADIDPRNYSKGDILSLYDTDFLSNDDFDPVIQIIDEDYHNEQMKTLFSKFFALALTAFNRTMSENAEISMGNFGFINMFESVPLSDDNSDTATPTDATPDKPTVDPDEPTVDPDEPTVEPDEPTVDPDEPTVAPDEPTVDPDKPSVEPDKPSVDPDKPSVEPEKPDDSKTPAEPSKPADAVTPGDSKATTSDSQKKSGVKADSSVISSYKSSANRDGGTSPDTSESMDGIIAAVVTAFVGVTGLIIVKKKEKNED